ncbi:MAG: hypothetical protein PHT69_06160 [Bacteroidales bacterium]|nr:hypothetical protein [Bacteroidales bacterium]
MSTQNPIKKLIITGFFLLLCFSGSAQAISETNNDTIFFRYFNFIDFENPYDRPETYVDTILDNFQLYEPARFGQGLGNTGKAFKNYYFITKQTEGFLAYDNVFNSYMPQPENIVYYNVSSPFTDLYYVMGGKKEQILKVTHSQNINRNFNVGINYNIINSPGSFRRQHSDISNFIVSSHFTGNKKRYRVIGNIIFNKCNNQENGGLDNIEEFKEDLLGRPELYEVRLINTQNKLKERGIFVKQYLHFAGKNIKDSLDQIVKKVFRTTLSHTIYAKRESLIYIDNNPNPWYYPLTQFDNTYTGDSTRYNILKNELDISHIFAFRNDSVPMLTLRIGLAHQYIDFRQFISLNTDSVIPILKEKYFFNQYIPKVNLVFNPSKKLKTTLQAYTVSGDYNNKDLGFSGNLNYSINSQHNLGLDVSFSHVQPAFMNNRFISNHFIWDYDFNKTDILHFGLDYFFKGYTAKAEFIRASDIIYYDAYARPKQYAGDIDIIQVVLNKNFRIYKFNFSNNLFFQKNSNSKVLPMPLFAAHHSLYWNTHVFKKALFAQIGIDLCYNTSYYGYSYLPATRSFYIQNHTLTGNYPVIDVFLNMEIKNARIFIKAYHLNERLTGTEMYTTTDYPLQGLAFKLGLSWMFRD